MTTMSTATEAAPTQADRTAHLQVQSPLVIQARAVPRAAPPSKD